MKASAEANNPRWRLLLCLSLLTGWIVRTPDMTYDSRDSRSAEQTPLELQALALVAMESAMMTLKL